MWWNSCLGTTFLTTLAILHCRHDCVLGCDLYTIIHKELI